MIIGFILGGIGVAAVTVMSAMNTQKTVRWPVLRSDW